MSKNSFLRELSTKCREVNITRNYATHIEDEIGKHVQLDTLTAYHISTGPMPGFVETKLDVFLLTKDFIYNYEVTIEFDDRWFTFPLTSISYIAERRSQFDSEFWSLLIGIRSLPVERGMAVLQSKIEDRDKIRKFANDCRENLSAIVKGSP